MYRAIKQPFQDFYQVQRRILGIWVNTPYKVLSEADAQTIINQITVTKTLLPVKPA